MFIVTEYAALKVDDIFRVYIFGCIKLIYKSLFGQSKEQQNSEITASVIGIVPTYAQLKLYTFKGNQPNLKIVFSIP